MSIQEYLPKVLISHSWFDKKEAMVIVDGLRDLDCAKVWIDFENMHVGEDISGEIRSQIQQSDFVILVWTHNSMGSKNVLNEIQWSREMNKTIIPCLFHFENNGQVSSELSENLVKFLGSHKLWVEFRTPNQGIIELHSSLNRVWFKNLPKEISDKYDAKFQILKKMEGYNKYLTNYRNVKHQEADRTEWISRIMNEIDSLEQMGADKNLINAFMMRIQQLETSDPEAYRVLKPRLEKFLSKMQNPVNNHIYEIPPAVSAPFQNSGLENLRWTFINMINKESHDSKSFQYLKSLYPNFDQNHIVETLQTVINLTGDGINLLNQAYILSFQAGLANEFNPILNHVTGYFHHEEDIRPDKLGPWGWVDDSYLCFSSLQQINQIYFSIFKQWLFQVNFDPYIQYLTQILNQNELHQLNSILKNKFSSVNWNGLLMKVAGLSVNNVFFGNYPGSQTNSTGKNWVERANDRTLRSWLNDLE